jgi:hypothetical protein
MLPGRLPYSAGTDEPGREPTFHVVAIDDPTDIEE